MSASEITSPMARPTTSGDIGLPQLVALHLVPGALVTAAFVALGPVVERLGLPPLAALLAAILLVMVPVELAIVVRAGRQAGGRGLFDAIRAAVPFREHMTRREWLVLVPLLLVAAFAGFGIAMPLDAPTIDALFGWVPKWFVSPVPLDNVRDYSAAAWGVTLAAYFALNGLVGPIVEELYFRGYLLPRMARFGRWAPLLNVALFSLYHFWSPWQFIARVLGVTPFAYGVWWKRNVFVGMAVHCTLNVIAVTIVATLVIGRL